MSRRTQLTSSSASSSGRRRLGLWIGAWSSVLAARGPQPTTRRCSWGVWRGGPGHTIDVGQ
eukprot:5243571-Prymnesium_polylepis.1